MLFIILAEEKGSYDHYIVNDDLNVAYEKLKGILIQVRNKVEYKGILIQVRNKVTK